MENAATAFLSMGSNKGEPSENLKRALVLLEEKDHTRILKVSRAYKTEPQDYQDQAWFENLAVKIQTRLAPTDLLLFLKEIESRLDKTGKEFRYGPRIIDLDIVYYEDLVFESNDLIIPHPKMHERCFVLQPVCDIGPETVHPVLHRTTIELLNQIKQKDHQIVIPIDKGEHH